MKNILPISDLQMRDFLLSKIYYTLHMKQYKSDLFV